MKFIEIPSILKTNILLDKITGTDLIEIEAYSCKNTKEVRKNLKLKKPLRYFVSALEMAFLNLDFSCCSLNDFKPITFKILLSDLSFILITLNKNQKDTSEYLNYLNILLKDCVSIKKSNIFIFDGISSKCLDKKFAYLIYDKKLKRILVVKVADRLF